jgi:Zn-dependent M28 family amino/carboxypeptidase
LIQALDQKPDRSIQIIFFAAEEIGLWGGRAWAENNKDNFHNIQLGAESDFGAGPIYEIKAKVSDEAQPVIRAIADALAPLGIELGGWGAWGGPDFRPAGAYGMAAVDLRQDGRNYFDYHHTENDTLDKIDPADMQHNAAAYAVLAWLAAQSPVSFGSGPDLIDPQG